MDLQITRQNILYKIKTLEKQLLDERKKLKRLVIEEAEQFPFLEDLEKDLEACTVYTHLDVTHVRNVSKSGAFWIDCDSVFWVPSFAMRRPAYPCSQEVSERVKKIAEKKE